LRAARGFDREWTRAVARLEGRGLSLSEALSTILLDPSLSQHERGAAGKLLVISDEKAAVRGL
jgi:hypothetical protein